MTEVKKINATKPRDWLYQSEGLIPLFSRLVGLISLPIGGVVWFFSHSGCGGELYPGPFNVPAWRFGSYLVPVPLPPEPVNIIVFALFGLAAVLLIVGKNSRPLYIYMASVLAYYCSRDFFVCMLHWVLLNFLFLLALAFRCQNASGAKEPSAESRSPARRLIQLTICSCYLFGVLQKLFYPDWCQGLSLEAAFYDGFAVTAPFRPLFINHPLPLSIWQANAIFLLFAETFIGLGLFFKPTRIAACILGFFLHGGILVMMDPLLSLFSLEMWLGYLAFFEKRRKKAPAGQQTSAEAPDPAPEPAPTLAPTPDQTTPPQASPIKTALALAYLALIIIMPMRIYFLPGPPPELLTLFERTPWTFGMFLMRQKQGSLEIAYEDQNAVRHVLEPSGRMKTASNDNELIAIAEYVFRQHPEAKKVSVNALIVVNERRQILRTLIWDKATSSAANSAASSCGSQPHISVIDAGQYCRGVANKNPAGDRHP